MSPNLSGCVVMVAWNLEYKVKITEKIWNKATNMHITL
jgi:hypothetical protein